MTYTDQDLAGIVDAEGLDYAILHYLDPEKILDAETKRLWIVAKEALEALDRHLPEFIDPFTGDEA